MYKKQENFPGQIAGLDSYSVADHHAMFFSPSLAHPKDHQIMPSKQMDKYSAEDEHGMMQSKRHELHSKASENVDLAGSKYAGFSQYIDPETAALQAEIYGNALK